MVKMEKSWLEKLEKEFDQPYMRDLQRFLAEQKKANRIIYPPENLIFNALCHCPFADVKAVIIGQDPYHNPGQAHGLSFSVPKGVKPPPSLQNIYKELQDDLGVTPPDHGCLLGWVEQGVILLNATLTVEKNSPKSHYGRGWERFTDAIVGALCTDANPKAFLLWGRSAQEKCENIFAKHPNHPHIILKAAHPSPFSAHSGFFGCKHFSKTNFFLKKNNKTPILWGNL